jgi:hypothetical protein
MNCLKLRICKSKSIYHFGTSSNNEVWTLKQNEGKEEEISL